MTDPNESELDEFFAAAKESEVPASPDLMARVLADAEDLQPRASEVARPHSSNLWAGLLDVLGGWPALGGVAAAGVAGLWLGMAPPASVEDLTSGLWGTTTAVSLMSDFDTLLEEGIDG